MPVQDLLNQLRDEYETLQHGFEQMVAENMALRSRFANFQTIGFPDNSKATLDIVSIGPHQRYLSSLPSHGARNPEEQIAGSEQIPEEPASGRELPWIDASARINADEFLTVKSRSSGNFYDETNSQMQKARHWLNNPWVELVLACIVMTNVAVMWISADSRATNEVAADWIDIVDAMFLVVYSVELGLRWCVMGVGMFRKVLNLVDLAVIVFDVTHLILRGILKNFQVLNVKMFRLFRLLRLARMIKFLRYFTELQLLIHGFIGATRALFFTALLLWLVILVWAFIFVEVVGPLVKDMTDRGSVRSCPGCDVAYSSVFQAHLTILQTTVAGDSWGILALAVIREYPATFPIYVGSLISIQLGVLNLIFTVIVDAATESRKRDEEFISLQKEREFESVQKHLLAKCRTLDADGSGSISVHELLKGLAEDTSLANMLTSLDITPQDLTTFYRFLDADNSGQLTYEEFVNGMYKLRKHDLRTTVFFLKGHMGDIKNILRQDVIHLLTSLDRKISEKISDEVWTGRFDTRDVDEERFLFKQKACTPIGPIRPSCMRTSVAANI